MEKEFGAYQTLLWCGWIKPFVNENGGKKLTGYAMIWDPDNTKNIRGRKQTDQRRLFALIEYMLLNFGLDYYPQGLVMDDKDGKLIDKWKIVRLVLS